jgi:D-serine deaminase-like pyridoxal phosphate-dependent protein
MDLAPHVKTTMAPKIIAAQLDAGAWGCTVATPAQAALLASLGVRRILLANQIADPAGLRLIAGQLARDPAFEFLCLADSAAGISALSRHAGPRPFRVLAELGHPGGRGGSRTVEERGEVVAAARAAPGVEVAGVAGYEGGLTSTGQVREYLRLLRRAADTTGAPLLSVGGSQWFDVIAEELAGCPSRVLLRSGAYVAHDDGYYRERTPFNRIEGDLRPALELWAHVLSAPEPGLAIAGFGKRDASFDEGLPVPRRVRREDGSYAPLTGVRVTAMQDQHAVLRGEGVPRPGELVAFGISHPCTAFDKWRALPVVDDRYAVIDVVHTCF